MDWLRSFRINLEMSAVPELLEPLDSRWVSFLKRVGRFDSYHEPAYSSLCGAHEGGQPFAVWQKDDNGYEFLMPILLRQVPVENLSNVKLKIDEYWDASSPYGFPGPLMIAPDGASPEASVKALLKFQLLGRDLLREKKVVSLFIRLHPIINQVGSCPVAFGHLSDPTQTVYVDLTRPLDEIHSKMSKSHRAGVRKLRQMGFTTIENDFSLLPDFIRLYHSTMARLDASENYYFGVPYFESLQQAFGDRLTLIMVRSPEGTMAAGGLFLEAGDFVQFHLSATAEEYRLLAPGKLTAIAGFEFFKARGREIFHFGGGVGGHGATCR